MATSLYQPESNGQVLARCLNFTEQSMKWSAGSTIGTFMEVEENEVDDRVLRADSKDSKISIASTGSEKVPGNLQKLYDAAKGSCREQESWRLVGLVTEYSTVFCIGSGYALADYSIPVMEETRLVCLLPHHQRKKSMLIDNCKTC